MPPRTRAGKSTKGLKENIGVSLKFKQKGVGKVNQPTRKVLGDKTNSASDDNTSVENIKKAVKKPSSNSKNVKRGQENANAVRPRRDRRLPGRYAENELLKNLSNKSSENIPIISKPRSDKTQTPGKNESPVLSPFKTPQKMADSSLVANRPKRISCLPSKFEDHSISPSKFIPVQPFHASTPIIQKSTQISNRVKKSDTNTNKSNKCTSKTTQPKSASNKNAASKKTISNTTPESGNHSSDQTEQTPPNHPIIKKVAFTRATAASVSQIKKPGPQKSKNLSPKKSKICSKEIKKVSPDNNNNPKGRVLRARKVVDIKAKVSPLKSSPQKPLQRPINTNYSYRILEDIETEKRNKDIYEFTYDPNEELPPQKKKRKAVKRKPAVPKQNPFVVKNNYIDNINKALVSLKNTVAKKQEANAKATDTPKELPVVPQQSTTVPQKSTQEIQKNVKPAQENFQGIPQVQRNIASKIIIGNVAQTLQNKNNTNQPPTIQQNIPVNIVNNALKGAPEPYSRVTNQSLIKLPDPNKSIRVEDIAADFEPSIHEDMNYSPVYSQRPTTPIPENKSLTVNDQDPLNLMDNASFFDEQPVASSSMNVSTKHPHASPWRIEFDNLPIRWRVNSYVKPSMTPAVECSFVNFDDNNQKKHVYVNMVPESNDPLPEIADKAAPDLVQTSIISFFKEVVERNSAKKRQRSATPGTPHLFTDTTRKTPEKAHNKNTEKEANKATRQLFTPKKNQGKAKQAENPRDTSSDKENSKESSKGKKRKNDDEISEVPAKTSRKDEEIETFFGFDETENLDQENPKKISEGRKKTLRPKARAILKEINEQGPTRAVVPLAAKTRQAEVERLYKEMKSASDAPDFAQKEQEHVNTAIEPIAENNEDSQSVHLFEDIEVIHHLKPQRKSYGKAKKVTFLNNDSDNDTQTSDPRVVPENSDDEDDLNDLTFNPAIPAIDEKKTKKKLTKKQKMTKKEAEEAEAWAAGFNSMCEDIDGFDLVVE